MSVDPPFLVYRAEGQREGMGCTLRNFRSLYGNVWGQGRYNGSDRISIKAKS